MHVNLSTFTQIDFPSDETYGNIVQDDEIARLPI